MQRVLLVAVLGLLGAGCRSVPTQACVDETDAYARDYVRCDGVDYTTTYDSIMDYTTSGHSCGAAHSLRDKESFYSTCIPWIEGLTCTQLHDPATPLDPSCMNQIILIHYAP